LDNDKLLGCGALRSQPFSVCVVWRNGRVRERGQSVPIASRNDLVTCELTAVQPVEGRLHVRVVGRRVYELARAGMKGGCMRGFSRLVMVIILGLLSAGTLGGILLWPTISKMLAH